MKKFARQLTLLAAAVPLLLFGTVSHFAQADPAALKTAESYIKAGRLSEAEPLLFDHIRTNPADARGYALFGRLRLAQNRLNEAKSLLKRALSLDPGSAEAALDLALAHLGIGESSEARAVLQGLSNSQVLPAQLRLEAAMALLRAGDCDGALKNADRLPPEMRDRDALPVRAECYVETGDSKALAGLMPLARALARRNAPIVIDVADALQRRGLHREALDLSKAVIAGAPTDLRARLLAARSEIVLKNFAGAKIQLAVAEKIAPDKPEVLGARALLEIEQGNFARAVELLEKALVIVPNDPLILTQFVVATMKANQSEKSVRAAETLLALKPDNLDYAYLLGAAALQNNSLRKAESVLTSYVIARPDDSRGCLALGLTYAAQPEKLEQALSQMRRCLEIDPNNSDAAYQLGLAYKTQGDTEKSVGYFEQTVRLSPNHAYALKELGVIYLQAGDEARARRSLEAAVALIPNDADVHFQLSRLYNLIGERELAKKHLELFQKLRDRKSGGM